MKIAALAACALTLAAGAAFAQTGMTAPAAKPALAHTAAMTAPAKTAPATHTATATTTPTKTGPSTMTTSKTTVKGAQAPRTAASLECSKQADAQTLHGKARKKMMSACKTAAKKS